LPASRIRAAFSRADTTDDKVAGGPVHAGRIDCATVLPEGRRRYILTYKSMLASMRQAFWQIPYMAAAKGRTFTG